MTEDVEFEAAFLRAALLVGLVHERDVPEWASRAIVSSASRTSQLAGVLACPIELSAMREALRRLEAGADQGQVTAALLTAVALAAKSGNGSPELLSVLGQIRREFTLPAAVAAAIKDFEDRSMLARAGLFPERAPGDAEIAAWLDDVRASGYFRFHFDRRDEMAAFAAALVRKVARDRTWGERPNQEPARLWALPLPGDGNTVVVNEPALGIAAREFSPLPKTTGIPYPEPGEGAISITDETSLGPRYDPTHGVA